MNDVEILRWETLTRTRFEEIDRQQALVMVTCSPLEVHGPHLPLGADALEGEALAERTIRHLPERHQARTFLKLPFLYSASDPVPQPGSLSFRPSTTMALLEDLGRSLAAQGFRNVVVSNFHGSPRHFLSIEQACHTVTRKHAISMVPIFSLMLSRLGAQGSELGDVLGHLGGVSAADFEGDTHGGLVETSQLLALHPDLVDPGYKELPRQSVASWLAAKGVSRSKARAGKLAALPRLFANFKASVGFFSEETYTGQPAKASAALGEEILDLLATSSAEALAEILDGRLPPDQWHSPVWHLRHLFLNPAAIRAVDAILGVPKTV